MADYTSALTGSSVPTGLLNLFRRPATAFDAKIVARTSANYTAAWERQAASYSTCWDWLDGTKLSETSDAAKQILKFPLQINPVVWVCLLHAGALYGEAPEDASSLVEFAFRNDDGKTDELCDKATRVVNRIWADSAGAELQLENAVLANGLGGCVYRVAWQPEDLRLRYRVRVSKVIPDYFLPVWDDDDPWMLSEANVVQEISPEVALARWGKKVTMAYALFVEHWDREKKEIRINDEVVAEEANPFGFVPFVYIPHETRLGGFYGKPHPLSVASLMEEYNSRMADRGDGVKAANIDRPIMRNAPGKTITVRTIGETFQVIDLGGGMPGSTRDPDMFYLEPNAVKGSQLSKEFTEDLWTDFCNDTSTPDIAWGARDTGSQRSSLTLEIGFWPLLAHIKRERIMQRTGLNVVNWMIRKVVSIQNPGELDKAAADLEPRTRWAKMLPRERDSVVNEMVSRFPAGLVSLETAVQRLAEGEDPEEEVERIKAAKEEEQQRLADEAEAKFGQQMEMTQAKGEQDLQKTELTLKQRQEKATQAKAKKAD